jgi:RNA-binding protein
MTGKERAAFRAQANTLDVVLQIGKDGIFENTKKAADDALTARELIKCALLESAPTTARQAAVQLAEVLSAEIIQVIGRRFVLYRYSEKLHQKKQS